MAVSMTFKREWIMDKVPNIFDIGFTKSFELAFNTVLKLDEMQGRAFEALDGKVIEKHGLAFHRV